MPPLHDVYNRPKLGPERAQITAAMSTAREVDMRTSVEDAETTRREKKEDMEGTCRISIS